MNEGTEKVLLKNQSFDFNLQSHNNKYPTTGHFLSTPIEKIHPIKIRNCIKHSVSSISFIIFGPSRLEKIILK